MMSARTFLYILTIFVILSAAVLYSLSRDSAGVFVEAGMLAVIIDAGHGGGDPGKVGMISYEDEINLAIAKKLEEKLQLRGFRVIMTRDSEEGLIEAGQGWKKKTDMQMRRDIIDASNADIFISIHQNAHANSVNRGAQVFYNGANEENRVLAEIMQRSVAAVSVVPNRRVCVDEREFMVLRGNSMPSCLIECGFMSNHAEEELLNTQEYQDKLAQAILESVCEYFGILP